jgi:hypothetical protein
VFWHFCGTLLTPVSAAAAAYYDFQVSVAKIEKFPPQKSQIPHQKHPKKEKRERKDSVIVVDKAHTSLSPSLSLSLSRSCKLLPTTAASVNAQTYQSL